jgi:two-component system sensor histidine kinase MprB
MGAATFFAFLLASSAAFVAAREIIETELDASIAQSAEQVLGILHEITLATPLAANTHIRELMSEGTSLQLLNRRGQPVTGGRDLLFRPSATEAGLAQLGVGSQEFRSVLIEGQNWRVVTVAPTVQNPQIGAVQVARSLNRTESVLDLLRRRLFFFALLAAGAASVIGASLADRITRPLRRLRSVAEEVAETGDLDREIEAVRADEIGALARAFNQMIRALGVSKEQQRRLVIDASHELRTPLTSLRTNVEVLQRVKSISPGEHEALMSDVNSELVELSDLVAELVQLATDEHTAEIAQRFRLDELVERVAERTQRRHDQPISVKAVRCEFVGRQGMLERALTNLVENASKWSPLHGKIEIVLDEFGLTVFDEGPGIPEEDRERVFDRFYRTDEARTMPGSGLGLAIVQQVVVAHGGAVSVGEGFNGGAAVGFTLPGIRLV